MTPKLQARLMALGVIASLFAATGLLVYAFGQDLETQTAPTVAETAPADAVYRDNQKGCFTLHLEKVGRGVDPLYTCTAKALYSPDLPVSLYPSDEKHLKHGKDLTIHRVGEKWPRVFCFDMPGTVADNQTVTLTCHGSHRRHPLWRSRSPLAPIKMCGTLPDDPPPDLPSRPDPFCERQRASFAAP